MSKPKHTHGRWRAIIDGESACIDTEHPKRFKAICKLYIGKNKFSPGGFDDETLDHEDHANAYLIAAAPEMLEALKLIANHFHHKEIRTVTGLNHDGSPSSVSIEMTMNTVRQIAEAIAKASGRTE